MSRHWRIGQIGERQRTSLRSKTAQTTHSEHRFPAPFTLKKGCRKPVFGVCSDNPLPASNFAHLRRDQPSNGQPPPRSEFLPLSTADAEAG